MTTPTKPVSFYTVSEAAALLRVSTMTLYRVIREGAFPAVKIQQRIIIPAKAVDALIEEAVTTGRCVDIAELTAARRRDQIGQELSRRGW